MKIVVANDIDYTNDKATVETNENIANLPLKRFFSCICLSYLHTRYLASFRQLTIDML